MKLQYKFLNCDGRTDYHRDLEILKEKVIKKIDYGDALRVITPTRSLALSVFEKLAFDATPKNSRLLLCMFEIEN
jgi:hypothetical protein